MKLGVRSLAFVAIAGLFVAVGLAALFANIMERKQEARNPFYRVVNLSDTTTDPAIWGKNFPLQYDAYRRTVDQVRTRYGGSEALPHSPTNADPRSVVAQSRLEEDPRLREFWSGYAFSKDFREERGHAHMLSDQEFTERQQFSPQPGTCLNCHASMYSTYLRLGSGDLTRGFEAINKMSYRDARANVRHPVSCVDCHDSQTMALRVTRPAFMEGIKAVKATQGVADYKREQGCEPAGNAHVRLRPVPCRVLLQGTGKASHVSLDEGSHRRQHTLIL